MSDQIEQAVYAAIFGLHADGMDDLVGSRVASDRIARAVRASLPPEPDNHHNAAACPYCTSVTQPHAYRVEILTNPGRPSEHWASARDESPDCDTFEEAGAELIRLADHGYSVEHLRIAAVTTVGDA